MVQGKKKFTLEQAMNARRGVEIQLYSFFNLGDTRQQVFNATPRPLHPRERDPVLIVQEAGWAPGPIWTSAENLDPTGIRFPDRAARSKSLHRLSSIGPSNCAVDVETPQAAVLIETQMYQRLYTTEYDTKQNRKTVHFANTCYTLQSASTSPMAHRLNLNNELTVLKRAQCKCVITFLSSST